MNQKRNVLIIAIVAILCVCIIAGYKLYGKLKPSTNHMGLDKYYGVVSGDASDKVALVLENQIAKEPAKIFNKEYYIDKELLTTSICDKFYWDEKNQLLDVTTPTEFIIVKPETTECTINGKDDKFNNIIVKKIDNKFYVSLSFIKKYSNVNVKEYNDPKRLVLTYSYGKEQYMTSSKVGGVIRFEQKRQSDIIKDASEGEKLLVLSGAKPLSSGFVRVRTEDGIIGYIDKKSVNTTELTIMKTDKSESDYTRIDKGNVSLGWYMASNQAANNNYSKLMANVKGVNAIAPTWFGFKDTDGHITSIASKDFVTTAHKDGYEVWGVIDDFSEKVAGLDIFVNTTSRQTMIKELISAVKENELDGINIDFEHINEAVSNHFIEFIRELSVECRVNKIVLSVDTYVPFNYNSAYRWADLSEVVDYVIIMGYDEFHKNSKTPGPSASISWTKQAVTNSLNEGIALEKLVIGMPFYSRYWKQDAQGAIVATETASMTAAIDMAIKANATPKWDDITQMNVVQYIESGNTVKIWFEDEKSIEAKMKVAKEAKVAGTAYWRIGYENKETWNVISNYVK